MLNNFKEKYNLNNEVYSHHELLNFCEQKINDLNTPEWEKEIFIFIESWLNISESVEVKTSGSTGQPKLIQFKKWQLIESARQTGKFFNLGKGDDVLLCLPATSIAGKLMIVRSLLLGLNLHYNKPQSLPLENNSRNYKFAAFTPHQVWKTLDNGGDINKVGTLIIGGGKVNSELELRLQNIETNCYATYGMTETLTHIAIQKLNGLDRQNSFTPFSGIKIRVDKRNCLCIKASYLENEVITNDIVSIDDDNNFTFIGRYDNVINSGGIKIFPEELEDKIYDLISHPFFIGSIPDDILNEKVILVIESSNYNKNELEELTTKLKERVDPVLVPKEIKFVKKISRTESGKIIRSINTTL